MQAIEDDDNDESGDEAAANHDDRSQWQFLPGAKRSRVHVHNSRCKHDQVKDTGSVDRVVRHFAALAFMKSCCAAVSWDRHDVSQAFASKSHLWRSISPS